MTIKIQLIYAEKSKKFSFNKNKTAQQSKAKTITHS